MNNGNFAVDIVNLIEDVLGKRSNRRIPTCFVSDYELKGKSVSESISKIKQMSPGPPVSCISQCWKCVRLLRSTLWSTMIEICQTYSLIVLITSVISERHSNGVLMSVPDQRAEKFEQPSKGYMHTLAFSKGSKKELVPCRIKADIRTRIDSTV